MGYNPGSSAKKVLKAQILVPRRGLQTAFFHRLRDSPDSNKVIPGI
jgi:hypothetical protein